MTEQEALDTYNEVRNEYDLFCRQNREAIDYLEELLARYRRALENLEAVCRRTGTPLGPIQRGTSRAVAVPEEVQKLAENRPDLFRDLGGCVETKYVLPVERVRQGVQSGLIEPSVGSALVRQQTTFKVPTLASLPDRRRT